MGALLFPLCARSRYSHSFKARSMPQLHTCRRQRVLQKRWGYWVNCGQCVWNSGRCTGNRGMSAKQTVHSRALPRSYKRSRIQWNLISFGSDGGILTHIAISIASSEWNEHESTKTAKFSLGKIHRSLGKRPKIHRYLGKSLFWLLG